MRRVSEAVDRRHEQSGRVPLGQAPRRSFDHTQTTLGPGGFPQAGRRVVRDRAAESATGREGSDEGEGASDATSCLGSRQARRPCTLKPWRAHMDTPTHTSMAVTGWPAMHAPKHRRAHSRRAGGQAEAVGGRLAGWQAGRQADDVFSERGERGPSCSTCIHRRRRISCISESASGGGGHVSRPRADHSRRGKQDAAKTSQSAGGARWVR